MSKYKAFLLAGILAFSAVYFNYWTDMNTSLNTLAKERLSLINYQTLYDGLTSVQNCEDVQKKLKNKSIEDYIISQCHLTDNMKKYFQNKDTSRSEYYNSVRDIESQILDTIDDLCEFMNERGGVEQSYIKKEN